jgi:hypothetical protein
MIGMLVSPGRNCLRDSRLAAEELNAIEVPGDRAFTESITAGPDGTLYLSSLASGGIARIKPGASKAEGRVAPGAFDSRSTFGVFADAKSNTLWVCSNDVSGRGSLAQVLRLAVTSRASIWRRAKARLAHSSPQNQPLQRHDRCQRRNGIRHEFARSANPATEARRKNSRSLGRRQAVSASERCWPRWDCHRRRQQHLRQYVQRRRILPRRGQGW